MLPMQMRLQLFLDRLPVLSKFEFLPPQKNGSSSVAYQPSQYRTLDDAGGAGGLGTLDSRGVSRASLSVGCMAWLATSHGHISGVNLGVQEDFRKTAWTLT